jgi:ABC-type branched-subunit amino acid transport system ATPase component
MNFVMGIADKVVVMDHGEEIAVGAPKQIQKNKRVIEAYLGEKVNL